jgi:hypothetical protein
VDKSGYKDGMAHSEVRKDNDWRIVLAGDWTKIPIEYQMNRCRMEDERRSMKEFVLLQR